jgi:hypothetical protein
MPPSINTIASAPPRSAATDPNMISHLTDPTADNINRVLRDIDGALQSGHDAARAYKRAETIIGDRRAVADAKRSLGRAHKYLERLAFRALDIKANVERARRDCAILHIDAIRRGYEIDIAELQRAADAAIRAADDIVSSRS